MTIFQVNFHEHGEKGFVHKQVIEASDREKALQLFLQEHYGKRAFFQVNRESSDSGTRLFGQIFKRVGKLGHLGVYGASLTNTCYIDIDEE